MPTRLLARAHRARLAVSLGLLPLALGGPARAQGAGAEPALAGLSLEQLMDIEVTTVSKHSEKLTDAPAAVFALTGDDLRRSGSPTLMEALRLAPGLQVAQLDAHDWAISSRGFAEVFANKLLVLQDGRSLYTPLFSGVFWDVQDTILADVDRVEVVRGPGATLWGANAVNGVINVITKPAEQTTGLLTSVAAGTDPELRGELRYGARVDDRTAYRVYAKVTRSGTSDLPSGASADDRAELAVAGTRVDHVAANGARLMFDGGGYVGRERQTFYVPTVTPPFVGLRTGDIDVRGGHGLGRWTQTDAVGETSLQAYFDYTDRKTAVFDDLRRTFDVEAQRRIALDRQELTVGAGYRRTEDLVGNTDVIALVPAREHLDLANAFVQDDLTLVPNRWHLIAGTKLEHNTFTGFELQPGLRALWTPSASVTAWASVARAVRTPSRADEDIQLHEVTPYPGVAINVAGNRDVRSEILVAYEAGLRFRPTHQVSVDVATYFNDYSQLRTTELTPASLLLAARLQNPAFGPVALPATLHALVANLMQGSTWGGEVAANAQLSPTWRLRTSYSYWESHFTWLPQSHDVSAAGATAGRSPRHQASVWSQHDVAANWRFDWRLRYVDRLPAIGIPSITELDLRLAWRLRPDWELSLTGENLLHRRHAEFVASSVITPATQIPRRGFLEMRHGF